MPAGWNQTSGTVREGPIDEDTFWMLFNYVFSDSSAKRTTYKFINNSNDIMSTKNSIRMSRPSIQSFGFDKNKNIQNINLNRIDAFGNKISKGDKDYKVSFIDQISSEKIAEVILINTYHKKTINENKTYICCNSCFIF